MPEPLSRKNQQDLENHETGVGDRCRHMGDSKTLVVPARTVAPLPCENVLVEKTRLTEAYLVCGDMRYPSDDT